MQQENNNYGRDQIVVNQPGTVVVNTASEKERSPNQKKLLEVVKQEVSDRLAQSLHLAIGNLINLGKESRPEWVRSPWDRSLSIQQKPAQILPPEMTIFQVFDQSQVARKLLILGEPGAGKTTTLLELARDLVTQAEQDPAQPIPVLLNLSLWNNPKQPMVEWLTVELSEKYGVRRELGLEWLRESALLPLLDGLDEVAPQHQEACAKALNEWLTGDVETHPVGLVVCCRCKEYEELVRERLFLQSAVFLQPLNETQIEQYLAQFGLMEVWHNAQSNLELRELLSKPLFLSIFGLVAATSQFDGAAWQSKPDDAARREYLFDCYWQATMTRPLTDAHEQEKGILSRTYGTKPLPTQRIIQRALVFAARALEQESQTELLIEKMQPSWLPEMKQKRMYRLISGLIFGLTVGLFMFNGGIIPTSELSGGPIYRLMYGLIPFLIPVLMSELMPELGDAQDKISSVEVLQILMSRETRREALELLFIVPIFGLIFGLVGGRIFGLLGGLISGLIGGSIVLNGGPTEGLKAGINTRIVPNQGIKNSWQNMLVLVAIAILFAIPFKVVLEHLLGDVLETTASKLVLAFPGFLIFLSFVGGGGTAIVRHIGLRIVLKWNGYAPFRYDLLLNYCTERLLFQRIGGRYRFMHRLLQEYFARMAL